MSIVLFGGEKGGTGKTTLATNMAAMLALQGERRFTTGHGSAGNSLFLGNGARGHGNRTPDSLRTKVRQGPCLPGA